MIVLRTTTQIPVSFKELEGVKFWISPLRMDQKQAITELAVQSKGGVKTEHALKASFLAVKYGVKRVEGLKELDGSDYKLDFGDSGELSDECVEDLLNLPCGFGVGTVISHLAYGQLDSANEVEGATVDFSSAVDMKKK